MTSLSERLKNNEIVLLDGGVSTCILVETYKTGYGKKRTSPSNVISLVQPVQETNSSCPITPL
jgi:hypothetical protein